MADAGSPDYARLPGVFAIALYSAFSLFQLSTVDLTFGEPFRNAEAVGLENYQWLLTNEHSTFWASLRITALYLLGTLIPELLIGFAIALLLNRKMRGNSLFTAVLIIPIVLMPSMVGLIGRLYFSYDGLVNYFLRGAHRHPPQLVWAKIWRSWRSSWSMSGSGRHSSF